jgi:RNA polymerase sigma-32 factor
VKELDADIRGRLDEFATTLSGRDIDIWHERMVSESPKTLQEIGDRFGVSRERARQLEARIMRRLSRFLDGSLDRDSIEELAWHG